MFWVAKKTNISIFSILIVTQSNPINIFTRIVLIKLNLLSSGTWSSETGDLERPTLATTICVNIRSILIYATRISGRYAPFILGLPAGFPRAHARAHFVRFSCHARKVSLHAFAMTKSTFPKFTFSHFSKILIT